MLNKILVLTALILTFTMVLSIYGENSNVQSLTESTFDSLVLQSKTIWVIVFYSTKCTQSQQLEYHYETLALALKGIVKLGAVDIDLNPSLKATYNIASTPLIKLFAENKQKPIDYDKTELTATDISEFVINQLKEIVFERLTPPKKASSSSSSSSSSSGQKKQTESPKQAVIENGVYILEDGNFEETVMKSSDMWLIEFYAPWCGHCKSLEPQWNDAAVKLEGKIKLGKLDATVNNVKANHYKVKGYPTIKIFPPGMKTDNIVENYEGKRDSDSIVAGALAKLESFGGSIASIPEQLLSQSQLEKDCINKTGVCVIALLPHILDSSADQRNNYIDILTQAMKLTKGKSINFLWIQGGDNYIWEEKMKLLSGYPALFAVSYSKKKYTVFKQAFVLENVKSFTYDLMTGKGQYEDLPSNVPSMKNMTAWDGKNANSNQQSNVHNDEL